jgi:hypothetical protein
MKKIETEQVARDVIKVKTPVILEQTSITRRCSMAPWFGSTVSGNCADA